jgi:hypothetical protein
MPPKTQQKTANKFFICPVPECDPPYSTYKDSNLRRHIRAKHPGHKALADLDVSVGTASRLGERTAVSTNGGEAASTYAPSKLAASAPTLNVPLPDAHPAGGPQALANLAVVAAAAATTVVRSPHAPAQSARESVVANPAPLAQAAAFGPPSAVGTSLPPHNQQLADDMQRRQQLLEQRWREIEQQEREFEHCQRQYQFHQRAQLMPTAGSFLQGDGLSHGPSGFSLGDMGQPNEYNNSGTSDVFSDTLAFQSFSGQHSLSASGQANFAAADRARSQLLQSPLGRTSLVGSAPLSAHSFGNPARQAYAQSASGPLVRQSLSSFDLSGPAPLLYQHQLPPPPQAHMQPHHSPFHQPQSPYPLTGPQSLPPLLGGSAQGPLGTGSLDARRNPTAGLFEPHPLAFLDDTYPQDPGADGPARKVLSTAAPASRKRQAAAAAAATVCKLDHIVVGGKPQPLLFPEGMSYSNKSDSLGYRLTGSMTKPLLPDSDEAHYTAHVHAEAETAKAQGKPVPARIAGKQSGRSSVIKTAMRLVNGHVLPAYFLEIPKVCHRCAWFVLCTQAIVSFEYSLPTSVCSTYRYTKTACTLADRSLLVPGGCRDTGQDH